MTSPLHTIFNAISVAGDSIPEFTELVASELFDKVKAAIKKEITRAQEESKVFGANATLDSFTKSLLEGYSDSDTALYSGLIQTQYSVFDRGNLTEENTRFKISQLQAIPKMYDSLKLRDFVGIQALRSPSAKAFYFNYPEQPLGSDKITMQILSHPMAATSRTFKTTIKLPDTSANIDDAIPGFAKELDVAIANALCSCRDISTTLTPDSNGVIDIEKYVTTSIESFTSPRGKINRILLSSNVYDLHKVYFDELGIDVVLYDWADTALELCGYKDCIVLAHSGESPVDNGIIFAPYHTFLEGGTHQVGDISHLTMLTRYGIEMHKNAELYYRVLVIPA